MSAEQAPQSLADALAALQADRESIPWPQRVELANGLRDRLEGRSPTLDAPAIVAFLADDPKPEVRQAVANLLPLLPDDDFERLRAKLKQDDNAFVQRSVERAIAKREQEMRTASKVRFGVDQIMEELRAIEKRHGEAAAQQAWRLCERYTELLVGSMVHDLRSILTHLKTNARAMIAESKANATTKPTRAAKRVKDDVEFLERTVRDMEQFTEPLTSHRAPEKLLDLVQTAHEIAVESVRSNDELDPGAVAVRIDVPEGITLHVARHAIVTALSNIIKNAYEAFVCPPAHEDVKEIAIVAAEDGQEVALTIRDNGMGFSPEEAKALRPWTPGRRNKTKRDSTGYGLPNAMRKISAHRGQIEFESEEGRGTSVVVRLPLNATGEGI